MDSWSSLEQINIWPLNSYPLRWRWLVIDIYRTPYLVVTKQLDFVFAGAASSFTLPYSAWAFWGWLSSRGGGGGVPAACNSKTINDNEMKFGGAVKDH